MIRAVDSSASRPGPAQVAQAAADGLGMWCGYIATLPGVRLYSPWDEASFRAVQALPGQPIAFASGWDDPVAVRELATSWGVRVGLDVESGIRADGDWVQGWLDASGAGLYGALSVHWHPGGRRAAFNIVANYPGYDPGRIWPPGIPRPDGDGPLGWQWQGTHDAWGCSVDALWLDERLGPQPAPVPIVVPRPGGTMFHPTIKDADGRPRWDNLIVGVNGRVYHDWGFLPDVRSVEDTGGFGIPGSEHCAWSPDGSRLLMRVVGTDAHVYSRMVALDGTLIWDWTPAVGESAEMPPSGVGPAGPEGPEGPPVDTSTFAERAHLHTVHGSTDAPPATKPG